MRNMKISTKLFVSFSIVILMALIVGAVGLYGLLTMKNGADDLYNKNLLSVEAMGNIREIFATQRNDMRNIFLSKDDPAKVKDIISGITASDQKANENFELYESTMTDPELEGDYFTAKNTWLGAFADMKAKTFSQLEAGDLDGAYKTFIDGGTHCIVPITNGLASSTSLNNGWALDSISRINSVYRAILIVLIVIILIAVASAIFITLYLSRSICHPLGVLTDFMKKAAKTGEIALHPEDVEIISKFAQNKDEVGVCIGSCAGFIEHISNLSMELDLISKGDLTAEIHALSDKDVIGSALQNMSLTMNNMFGEINSSTTQVRTGSQQIADGAQSLAQGSTEQAATVQQLSASITEIAEKTKNNAEMAEKSAALAGIIMQNAEKGSSQMNEMMAAVKEINHASQSISKVIKVIDDIAFQTNILALNAAVEAARAGQHGKGFAVVAEEVRNLAAKSAEAAKDTGELIANSMEKAELGARIADDTASSLAEIVSGINESSRIAGDIAKSSGEQTVGISQINEGIDQVAMVVQQNSATAEESAAASEELSSQAEMLMQLVAQFKLKGAVDAGHQRFAAQMGGYGPGVTSFALSNSDKY